MLSEIRRRIEGKSISEREIQVLRLISFELTTKEIAGELFISPHTVISHRRNIMIKLDAKNSAGMIRKGFEAGLLSFSC